VLVKDSYTHGGLIWTVVGSGLPQPALRPNICAVPSTTPIHWSWQRALTDWTWGPLDVAVVCLVVAIAAWYVRATRRLARRGRAWPARRSAAFLLGLVLVDLAFQSPLDSLDDTWFQVHVIQHLILMIPAPVLLALGAPSTLLLQTAGRRIKVAWLKVLRSLAFRALTFPVVVWFLYFGVMVALFQSSLFNFATQHPGIDEAFHALFLAAGTLYWWPLVGLDPIIHWRMGYGLRIIYLLTAAPFEAFLGIAIMSERHRIATIYSLSSTHAGGAILWAATEASVIFGIIPVFLQWLRSDARAAARSDARLERARTAGRPLEPAAPRAAVTAGAEGQWAELFQAGNSVWAERFRSKAGHLPTEAS
jgi:cytochrome c oxidase assembly factor CtaG